MTAKSTVAARCIVERCYQISTHLRVTGLADTEFASDFLTEKVGDYFYSQGCAVISLELWQDAVLLMFADERSARRALALNGKHDRSYLSAQHRPHGRLVCNSGGMIIQCESHLKEPSKSKSGSLRVSVVTTPPTPVLTTSTNTMSTQRLINSSLQTSKKSPIQKSVSLALTKVVPAKPRPWDPCDKVVAVQVLEGVSLAEFQAILLGVDGVNYTFLKSLPNCEIRYHEDTLEFSIKAKHQTALLQAEELIQDLLEHVREEVDERLEVVNNQKVDAVQKDAVQEVPIVMDDIRVQVVQYNKLAVPGWAIPCVSHASVVVDNDEDAESEATKVYGEEDAKSEASTSYDSVVSTGSVGFVQVERVIQKTIRWRCGSCEVMNFASNCRSCQWCGTNRKVIL